MEELSGKALEGFCKTVLVSCVFPCSFAHCGVTCMYVAPLLRKYSPLSLSLCTCNVLSPSLLPNGFLGWHWHCFPGIGTQLIDPEAKFLSVGTVT